MSGIILFAYFSPETYLPVTSVLATVLGVLMMFGRTSLRIIVRAVRRVFGRATPRPMTKGPHFGHVHRTESETEGRAARR